VGIQQELIGFLNFKRFLKAQFLKNGLGQELGWGRRGSRDITLVICVHTKLPGLGPSLASCKLSHFPESYHTATSIILGHFITAACVLFSLNSSFLQGGYFLSVGCPGGEGIWTLCPCTG
jgi:hypothetical protein